MFHRSRRSSQSTGVSTPQPKNLTPGGEFQKSKETAITITFYVNFFCECLAHRIKLENARQVSLIRRLNAKLYSEWILDGIQTFITVDMMDECPRQHRRHDRMRTLVYQFIFHRPSFGHVCLACLRNVSLSCYFFPILFLRPARLTHSAWTFWEAPPLIGLSGI